MLRIFRRKKIKSRNEEAILSLTQEMQAIGFVEVEKGLLQNEHLTLKILDQRYDGVELYIKYSYGSARIDFMLEYYLSKKLELSRMLYRKEITFYEFHIQFLKRYMKQLSTHEGVMKPYQEWKLNPEPHFKVLRQMIIEEKPI